MRFRIQPQIADIILGDSLRCSANDLCMKIVETKNQIDQKRKRIAGYSKTIRKTGQYIQTPRLAKLLKYTSQSRYTLAGQIASRAITKAKIVKLDPYIASKMLTTARFVRLNASGFKEDVAYFHKRILILQKNADLVLKKKQLEEAELSKLDEELIAYIEQYKPIREYSIEFDSIFLV